MHDLHDYRNGMGPGSQQITAATPKILINRPGISEKRDPEKRKEAKHETGISEHEKQETALSGM